MLASLQLLGFELLELRMVRDPLWRDDEEIPSYVLEFAVGQQRFQRDEKYLVFGCQQSFSMTQPKSRRKKGRPKFKELSYMAAGYLIFPLAVAAEVDGNWGRAIAINCQSILFGVARGIFLQNTGLTGAPFCLPSLNMEEVFDDAFDSVDDDFFCQWVKTGEGNEEMSQLHGITYSIGQRRGTS